jgi:hypothetical protein
LLFGSIARAAAQVGGCGVRFWGTSIANGEFGESHGDLWLLT